MFIEFNKMIIVLQYNLDLLKIPHNEILTDLTDDYSILSDDLTVLEVMCKTSPFKEREIIDIRIKIHFLLNRFEDLRDDFELILNKMNIFYQNMYLNLIMIFFIY